MAVIPEEEEYEHLHLSVGPNSLRTSYNQATKYTDAELAEAASEVLEEFWVGDFYGELCLAILDAAHTNKLTKEYLAQKKPVPEEWDVWQ